MQRGQAEMRENQDNVIVNLTPSPADLPRTFPTDVTFPSSLPDLPVFPVLSVLP
jgi:hypothetical protein